MVEKVTTFGTYGVSVTLLRLAYRSLLSQRRVLARPRCIRASGHDTRRHTVLQSSAATLAESSAPTAVRAEFASQRSSLLQTSGCRGRHMVRNNHAVIASCSGAARRAADAFAALPRLLQQHAAHTVLEATWSESSRNIELLTAKSFFLRTFDWGRAQMVRVPNLNGRTSESAPCANAVFLPVRGPMFTLTTQHFTTGSSC